MKHFTKDEVLELLKKGQGERNQREYADEIGVSQQYLCDVLVGRRDPGPAILEYLNIEKGYVQA